MRDRLIELLKSPHKAEQLRQLGVDIGKYEDDCIEAMIADFLLANGVVVPPCKVGDTVYSIKATYSKCHLGTYWDEIRCDGCECTCDSHSTYSIQEETVIEVSCGGRYWCVKTNKTNGNFVFLSDTPYGRYLTKEEAEKALAERSENGTN